MVSPVAATPDGLRRPGLAVHCCSGFEDAQEGGRSPTRAVLQPFGYAWALAGCN